MKTIFFYRHIMPLFIVMFLMTFMMWGCKNEVSPSNVPMTSDELLSTMSRDVKHLSDIKVYSSEDSRKCVATRSGETMEDNTFTTLYSDISFASSVPPGGGTGGGGSDTGGDPTMPTPQTFTDLMNDVGAGGTISLFKDEETTDSIRISNQEAREALRPSIDSSIAYLTSCGLTVMEIRSALQECNAEEYTLIPIALDAANFPDSQQMPDLTTYMFNVFLPNTFNAYAASQPQNPQWGTCLGRAILIDEILSIYTKRSLTKAALKVAIRKVAARALGWVGAAIFVYDFSDCMGWI